MPLISLLDATSALNSLSANSRPLGPLSCCWTRFWFSQMAPSIRVPQQPPPPFPALTGRPLLLFFFCCCWCCCDSGFVVANLRPVNLPTALAPSKLTHKHTHTGEYLARRRRRRLCVCACALWLRVYVCISSACAGFLLLLL